MLFGRCEARISVAMSLLASCHERAVSAWASVAGGSLRKVYRYVSERGARTFLTGCTQC